MSEIINCPRNGIQAAYAEMRGEGKLSVEGKAVVFRDIKGAALRKFWAATPKDAAQQLRIFRAAPKYVGTENA